MLDTCPDRWSQILDQSLMLNHRQVISRLPLAFHLQHDSILGLFEHHTHLLTRNRLEDLIVKLVEGKLTNEEVYNDGGHGCLTLESRKDLPFVSVVGPQRSLMAGSNLSPYFASPYGDMMLAGCFGLVRAFAHRIGTWRGEMVRALDEHNSGLIGC